MFKKALVIGSFLISTSLHAIEGGSDYFLGWTGVQQNFEEATNYNKFQKGIDFGTRLYFYINDDSTLALGFEGGFSHIETDFSVGGNITRGQFVLKYRFLPMVEIFGGGGLAARGTPSSDDNGIIAYGGFGNGGLAFVTLEDKLRLELTGSYYGFATTINGIDDTISSYGIALHLGVSIE